MTHTWTHEKRRLARALTAVSLIAVTVLAAPTAVSAAPWDGTPGYFTGNGNPDNSFGGTPLDVNAGGTLQYASETYPASLFSSSFLLDGVTRLRNTDTSVGELGTGDFAIGVHFNTSTSAPNIGLLSKESAANCDDSGQWWRMDLANGGVYVEMFGPASQVKFNGTIGTGLVDGNWHNVELTRSGDVLYLHIDGQLAATQPFSGANPSNASDNLGRLRIGSNPCGAGSVTTSTPMTGMIADAYVGPGALYTLSVDDPNTVVPAGSSGGPALSYHSTGNGVMATDVTAPTDTTLSSLAGPGCNTATAHCQFPLTGAGSPITASVAVPASATPGTTFDGGYFSMGDLMLPLSPASTGWNPDDGSANVAFSVTAAPEDPIPLIDLRVLGGLLVALGLAAGGRVWMRRSPATDVHV